MVRQDELVIKWRHLPWCSSSLIGQLIMDADQCRCKRELELAMRWMKSLDKESAKHLRTLFNARAV